MKLGQLQALREINFTSNMITGLIPNTLGSLTKLVSLDLSKYTRFHVLFVIEKWIADWSCIDRLQPPDWNSAIGTGLVSWFRTTQSWR